MDRETADRMGHLPEERRSAIFLIHEKDYLSRKEPVEAGEVKTAVFLAGQPGSGKGTLSRMVAAELPQKNTVVIDVDALRELHPNYKGWQADPATAKDASSMTHQFAVEMGQKMMASAIKNNLNVVVDGTLSNPEQATKQIAALKGEHYKIEVKALAVQREVSELGVYKRFEDGMADGNPRWVPASVREYAYAGLPQTLDVIEQNQSKLNAGVQVYNRKGDKLYDNREPSVDGPKSARAGLEAERERPLSRAEKKQYSDNWGVVIESMRARGAAPDEVKEAAHRIHQFRDAEKSNDKSGPAKAILPAKPHVDAPTIGLPMSQRDIENSRKLVGDQFGRVLPARVDGQYAGKVLYMTETHLVQKTGKATVIAHDLSKLENRANLGKRYEEGTLTNKTLKISYGNDKGNAEIVPSDPRRAMEIKGKAGAWADKSVNDSNIRGTFNKQVELATKDIARPVHQAAKQKEAPITQKTLPNQEKVR